MGPKDGVQGNNRNERGARQPSPTREVADEVARVAVQCSARCSVQCAPRASAAPTSAQKKMSSMRHVVLGNESEDSHGSTALGCRSGCRGFSMLPSPTPPPTSSPLPPTPGLPGRAPAFFDRDGDESLAPRVMLRTSLATLAFSPPCSKCMSCMSSSRNSSSSLQDEMSEITTVVGRRWWQGRKCGQGTGPGEKDAQVGWMQGLERVWARLIALALACTTHSRKACVLCTKQ